MRFKEIKPAMVIHCKTEEEAERLCEHLCELGYVWTGGSKLNRTKWETHREKTCYHIREGFKIGYSGNAGSDEWKITEFSDLIIPELSAEEVLEICNEICIDNDCISCPMREKCFINNETDFKKVVELCEQWKTDHEKKEPEVETEWFWQGRIYITGDNGIFWQVKDGTGFYDTGCESRESAEEYMEDKLKEFCKTHEGEYIATVERVCRVNRKE